MTATTKIRTLAVTAVAAFAIGALGVTATAQNGPATVTGGTAIWGLSEYLNSANFGRPNPHPEAYVAPAAFDEAARLSSWGDGTGTIAADGTAALAYSGTAVNFGGTSGAWIKIADIEVSLDAEGNGTLSAEVSYGVSVTGTPPAMTFDPAQPPLHGPERVVILALEGNAVSPTVADGVTTWADLQGVWTAEFGDFLAAGPWTYASTVTNDTPDRAPLPLTLTATTAP